MPVRSPKDQKQSKATESYLFRWIRRLATKMALGKRIKHKVLRPGNPGHWEPASALPGSSALALSGSPAPLTPFWDIRSVEWEDQAQYWNRGRCEVESEPYLSKHDYVPTALSGTRSMHMEGDIDIPYSIISSITSQKSSATLHTSRSLSRNPAQPSPLLLASSPFDEHTYTDLRFLPPECRPARSDTYLVTNRKQPSTENSRSRTLPELSDLVGPLRSPMDDASPCLHRESSRLNELLESNSRPLQSPAFSIPEAKPIRSERGGSFGIFNEGIVEPSLPTAVGHEVRVCDQERSHWIDMERLRLWLQKCNCEHRYDCSTQKELKGALSGRPRWLIDVSRLCLLPAKPTDRYIALSYVWGRAETAKALTSNLHYLKRDGSLSDGSTLFTVPRTIRDAINLVRLLDERYVWIDSLCIVQDDKEAKHAQLQDMAAIYANAYVTIIAAEADDVSQGLRGIRGFTPPKDCSSPSVELLNWNDTLLRHHHAIAQSVWYSRGWTYQEFLFSTRKIFFQKNQVIWECRCAVWDENTNLLELNRDDYMQLSSSRIRGLHFTSWPNLQDYMDLVQAYNTKDLSYPEDALAAFAGITTTLSRTYEGGFLCGLPVMFFDVALLWSNRNPLKRRIPSKEDSLTAPLPSWSWAGWKGDLYLEAWSSCVRDYCKGSEVVNEKGRKLHIIPIMQWYCSHKPYQDPRPIYCSYQRYRTSCTDLALPLPWGWTRHHFENVHFFTHETDPGTDFWYPIPLRPAEPETEVGGFQCYISGRTRRAFFRLSEISDELTLSLQNIKGELVGEITSNEALPQCIKIANYHCEVIILSGYSSITSKGEKQGYNIMWIEWKGRIAYRKGIGTVFKEVFDCQPLEWIDVTLG